MTLKTQAKTQTQQQAPVLAAQIVVHSSQARLFWEPRLHQLPTERPIGRSVMKQKCISLQPRAGFNPEAVGHDSSANLESRVERARQKFIKAYLRGPVLDQVQFGAHQPPSLAEALDRAEHILDSVDCLAA